MIDLRTDTLTPPTDEMWEAMRGARFGWAMKGEDRAVLDLEALGADLTGKESALIAPTCSMANLLALLAQGERGTQVVLEATSHTVTSEGWGIAAVASLFPRLLVGRQGIPDATEVEAIIAEAGALGLPRTSVVCLENTHNNAGGIAISPAQTAEITEAAHRHGAAVHVDGARLFNAALALGVRAGDLTATVDTVAISLNKGLCAPVGALLCGRRDTIDAARGHARRLGAASMHKVGILAAAGIVALTTMVDRLADDNRRAALLADRLRGMAGLHVDWTGVRTNIVFAELQETAPSAEELARRLEARGVLAYVRPGRKVRFVTHRLIDDGAIALAAAATYAALSEGT